MEQRPTPVTEHSCPQCGAPVRLPGVRGLAVCASCGSTLTRERTRGAAEGAGRPPGRPGSSGRCGRAGASLGPVLSVRRPPQRTRRSADPGLRSLRSAGGGEGAWRLLPLVLPTAGRSARGYGRGSRLAQTSIPGSPSGLERPAIAEARLVYAPIWEHKALVAGWEFGHKLRTRYELVGDEKSERLDLQLVREGVEEPRLQERRFYQAATDLAALGATRPRITGRELMLPLLAGELDPSATVLEAEGAADQVAASGAEGRAAAPSSGAESPDSHLFALRESTALLYYPSMVTAAIRMGIVPTGSW